MDTALSEPEVGVEGEHQEEITKCARQMAEVVQKQLS